MSISWNDQTAGHLLRRTGFGASAAEIAKAVKAGQAATLKSILKFDKKSDKLSKKDGDDIERLATWWLRRMMTTKTPLAEKLALFWHNHFATGNHKVDDVHLMHRQNQVFRKLGMGKFRDLALAVARDPAMIYWLDSQTNIQGSTNKNFARELQELFTTGVLDKNGLPNYTETDVDEAARAFTGWQTDRDGFVFNSDDHDFDTKTFKGHTGAWDGVDIINFLVVEDATARRICKKLFAFFAYDVPLNDPVIDTLSNVYLSNDTDIFAVMSAMLQMDEFYSAPALRSHVLGPAEYLAATCRLLKITVASFDHYTIQGWCQDLGQKLFDPPSVFGWKEGLPWLATTGVLQRARVAEELTAGRKGDGVVFDAKKIVKTKLDAASGDAYVDSALAALGMKDVSAATRTELIHYLSTNTSGFSSKDLTDMKSRGLFAILLSTPEYQLS